MEAVFSESLMTRVKEHAFIALRLAEMNIDASPKTKDTVSKSYNKEFGKLSDLFNTYNIFSQEFKSAALGAFHSIYLS